MTDDPRPESLASWVERDAGGGGLSRGRVRASFWRSPLRGPWLTSALGAVLMVGLPVVMLTGLLSNAAYDLSLKGNLALQGRVRSPLDFYAFTWPAHPSWLYALTAGVHVALGLALIPAILVKQWSVLPRFFARPLFRSPAHMIERVSLVFLVGGIFFEIVTGVLFIEYWLPFHFGFTAAHYYGAWVFFGAFILHTVVKLPKLRSSLATRGAVLRVLRTGLAATAVESPESLDLVPDSLVPIAPEAPTISRRALLGAVGAGSALLGVQGIAQDVGGPLRPFAFLLPRGSKPGSGPNEFPVNGTWASLGLPQSNITRWRLSVMAPDRRTLTFTREQLQALGTHTYDLQLSCREGWSTTQAWTGVRLRELAAHVGVSGSPGVYTTGLDGATAALAPNQVSAEDALLALDVNGVPLSPDHGFPARVIVPGAIAVDCLKWVDSLTFTTDREAT
jgi:DMSO/TMAO reductase YedYZ molybdopterin-dependent catalytic subunit